MMPGTDALTSSAAASAAAATTTTTTTKATGTSTTTAGDAAASATVSATPTKKAQGSASKGGSATPQQRVRRRQQNHHQVAGGGRLSPLATSTTTTTTSPIPVGVGNKGGRRRGGIATPEKLLLSSSSSSSSSRVVRPSPRSSPRPPPSFSSPPPSVGAGAGDRFLPLPPLPPSSPLSPALKRPGSKGRRGRKTTAATAGMTAKMKKLADEEREESRRRRRAALRRILSVARSILIDLPLAASFALYVAARLSRYDLYENYYVPLMDRATRTDDDLRNEYTYYHRTCTAGDLSTRDIGDLLVRRRRRGEGDGDGDYDDYYEEDDDGVVLDKMSKHGGVVIPGVLSRETAKRLREFVVGKNAAVRDDEQYPVSQGHNRISYGIDATEDPVVSTALREVADDRLVAAAVRNLLGDPDPAVAEITAITSYLGCPDQAWHSDTKEDGNALKFARTYSHSYSLFLPLQDTTMSMGVTDLCPGTQYCANNLEEMCQNNRVGLHEANVGPVDFSGIEPSFTGRKRNKNTRAAAQQDRKHFRAGDGALLNQHVWHRGSAHVDPTAPERVVFIVSFLARPKFWITAGAGAGAAASDHDHDNPADRGGAGIGRVVDTRQLSRGTYFHLKWNMWGHTYNDLLTLDYYSSRDGSAATGGVAAAGIRNNMTSSPANNNTAAAASAAPSFSSSTSTTMNKPFSILRCLSLWKPPGSHWGYDLLTSVFMRFSNEQLEEEDLEFRLVPRLVDQLHFPTWLLGTILPLYAEIEVPSSPIDSASSSSSSSSPPPRRQQRRPVVVTQKMAWTTFVRETMDNTLAFLEKVVVSSHSCYVMSLFVLTFLSIVVSYLRNPASPPDDDEEGATKGDSKDQSQNGGGGGDTKAAPDETKSGGTVVPQENKIEGNVAPADVDPDDNDRDDADDDHFGVLKRGARRLFTSHATVLLLAYGASRRVRQSEWGRNVLNGVALMKPFPPPPTAETMSRAKARAAAAVVQGGTRRRQRASAGGSFPTSPMKLSTSSSVMTAPGGPTTRPISRDVLIGTRYDAGFLGSYDRWLDHHPGNSDYLGRHIPNHAENYRRHVLPRFGENGDDGFIGGGGIVLAGGGDHDEDDDEGRRGSDSKGPAVPFDAVLSRHILRTVIDDASANGGWFLSQSHITGYWHVMSDDEAARTVHEDLLTHSSPALRSLRELLRRRIAAYRYGTGRETTMARATQLFLHRLWYVHLLRSGDIPEMAADARSDEDGGDKTTKRSAGASSSSIAPAPLRRRPRTVPALGTAPSSGAGGVAASPIAVGRRSSPVPPRRWREDHGDDGGRFMVGTDVWCYFDGYVGPFEWYLGTVTDRVRTQRASAASSSSSSPSPLQQRDDDPYVYTVSFEDGAEERGVGSDRLEVYRPVTEGDPVEGCFHERAVLEDCYPGVVTRVMPDGAVSIAYDDGDYEERVPRHRYFVPPYRYALMEEY